MSKEQKFYYKLGKLIANMIGCTSIAFTFVGFMLVMVIK